MKTFFYFLIFISCVGCDSSRKISSISNTDKKLNISEFKNENHNTLSELNYSTLIKNNLNIKIIEYFPSDSSGNQDVKRVVEIIDHTEKADAVTRKDSVSIIKNDTVSVEEIIDENIEIREEKKFESGKSITKCLFLIIIIGIIIIICLKKIRI